MTTIGIARGALAQRPVSIRLELRRVLLAFGILSSVLYVATDLAGAHRYPGYDLGAQAISELMAAGAPSEEFVDPLFLFYDLLVLGFAIGVMMVAGRARRLTTVGLLLAAYGIVGLTGPTLFEMQPRGTASLAADAPHIVLTGAISLLLLGAMVFGALSLGDRFRTYSFATAALCIALGVAMAPFAAPLAAGEPTPGFGLLERTSIYASMLWIGVLGATLLRREPRPHGARRTSARAHAMTSRVEGFVASGFEEVRREFERNFTERGDIGAAMAAYWKGELVADLWGGWRTPERDAPWNRDTMVVVMSSTKGLAAMTLAVANSRGWIDYDAPVARYWPEFAQQGKEAVTVRQLLGHEAGLVLLDEKVTIERLHDLDDVAGVLARQKPAWPPGTRHGYHTMTIGLCMQELIRRVDPAHRTLGKFFHDEIALPLGIEFYIGLPPGIPSSRLAKLRTLSRLRAIAAVRSTPVAILAKMFTPGSLLRRSFVGMDLDWDDRRTYEVEVPAGNGVGTARAIARAYSAFAEGGREVGLTPRTFALLTEPPAPANPTDFVLGVPSYFSLGFLRPGPDVAFGSSQRAFGSPGAGGSFGFADPDARVGFAYVMNRLDFHLVDDPREKALRDALYRAIARRQASFNDDSAPAAAPNTTAPTERMSPRTIVHR